MTVKKEMTPEEKAKLIKIHQATSQYLKMMHNTAGPFWREIIVDMFARVSADAMAELPEKDIHKFMLDMEKSVKNYIKRAQEERVAKPVDMKTDLSQPKEVKHEHTIVAK